MLIDKKQLFRVVESPKNIRFRSVDLNNPTSNYRNHPVGDYWEYSLFCEKKGQKLPLAASFENNKKDDEKTAMQSFDCYVNYKFEKTHGVCSLC